MEPGQSWAFEAGWEHFTQNSVVPGVEDHCLVELQHMIVRVGGVIVHSKWRNNESTRRFIVKNMLAQRRGQHVVGSPDGGIKGCMRGGERPKWVSCM